jgi:2-isopropylmalate synthase
LKSASSASQTDFDIVRHLIDAQLIPHDVTPMVITQLREDLIATTVRSVAGARRVIVHLYNAVAPAFREIVFGMEVPQIIAMVEHHVRHLRQLTEQHPETEWVLQYSRKPFAWPSWTFPWPCAMPPLPPGMPALSAP